MKTIAYQRNPLTQIIAICTSAMLPAAIIAEAAMVDIVPNTPVPKADVLFKSHWAPIIALLTNVCMAVAITADINIVFTVLNINV